MDPKSKFVPAAVLLTTMAGVSAAMALSNAARVEKFGDKPPRFCGVTL